MSITLGTRIGPYEVTSRLGEGGMGVVYRAQQHFGLSTRPVAVKLIHPTLLRTAREEALATQTSALTWS